MTGRTSLPVAFVAAFAAVLGAQTPQQTPTFRTKLELIQVDVTVLGPDGKPMRGLAASDFTLLDEGVEQPIRGFAEVSIPDATDGPLWIKDSSPDVRTAADGRVLVFVLDDAMIRTDLRRPGTIAMMRTIAGEVVDRMGPTDVAAVICTYDTRCAQDFTSDRALLKAAIAKFAPKSFNATALDDGRRSAIGPFRPYDWSRQSAGVAGTIVQYLIEQPGRRKSLIYVSPTLPTRPKEWPCPLSLPECALESAATLQQMIRTFQHAFKSKVTVYGISPHGLEAIADDAPEALLRSLAAAAAPGPPVGISTPTRSLATETGGFVVSGDGSFDDGIAQIFRETGSYYLLGYEKPANPVTEYHPVPGYRTLEIRVNRPGAVVRSKLGYVVPDAPKPVTRPPPAGDAALAGILPKTDLPLRVTVAPFATPGRTTATLAITLAVIEPAPSARTLDRLDVQIRAFTQRGEARGATRRQVSAILPSGREGDAPFEVISALALKPGVYALRLSVVSERLGTSGSVYTDVEVPDFAEAPLSLSGVLVTVLPRPAGEPADALAALVPVAPTTLRQFDRAQHASAFVRVYQGKGPVVPVAVSMRVFDAANRAVVERVDTLEAAQFRVARAADYSCVLPLASLASGQHLLRIEASAGDRRIRRDVQFIVK